MGDRKKVYLNFRNNLIMMTKNLPVLERTWKIPVRIVLDIIAAYRSLIDGNFSTFISIASAHMHYVEWVLTGKRGKKFSKIKMKDILPVYDGSIVWQYYIKQKKTFSEIIPFKK